MDSDAGRHHIRYADGSGRSRRSWKKKLNYFSIQILDIILCLAPASLVIPVTRTLIAFPTALNPITVMK